MKGNPPEGGLKDRGMSHMSVGFIQLHRKRQQPCSSRLGSQTKGSGPLTSEPLSSVKRCRYFSSADSQCSSSVDSPTPNSAGP